MRIKDDEFYRIVALSAVPLFFGSDETAPLDTNDIAHCMRTEGYDVSEADVVNALARWRDENTIIELTAAC